MINTTGGTKRYFLYAIIILFIMGYYTKCMWKHLDATGKLKWVGATTILTLGTYYKLGKYLDKLFG